MKKNLGFPVFLLCMNMLLNSYAAEAEKIIYEGSPDDLSKWKSEVPELTVCSEKNIEGHKNGVIKLHFTVDNNNGTTWPQALCGIPETELEANTFVEFDYYIKPIKGKIKCGFGVRPANKCKEKGLPDVRPEEWHRIRLPLLLQNADTAKINALYFYIGEKYHQTGDEAIVYIDNIKIISCPKVILSADTTLTDAKLIPVDLRQEIEIPNLLVNGYFREGGTKLPPRGWDTSGQEKLSYAASRHDGQAIRLGASNGDVILRQYGIILIPGELYRISGYVRGDNFKGTGGIGVICDNWSKFWGFKINSDLVKHGWYYFETVFSPGPSKSGDYHAVIYRQNGSGSLDVDRVVLEPLTEKGLKESRNKLAGNKFDDDYAKALKEGRLKEGPPSDDYQLVWSDEFDGTQINQSKWKIYDMTTYKDKRGYVLTPKSVTLNGKGQLLLSTRLVDGIVEQPRMSTCDGKYETAYGYFECRAKFQQTNLANAAFWMLPAGHMDAHDPVHKGMEIDIFECVQPKLEKLSHTTHWYSKIDGKLVSYSGGTVARTVTGLPEGFHSIGLEWTPDEYVFYIDGVESLRFRKKDHPISINPHNMILTFGGRVKSIKEIPGFSDTFEVDYVRVYKKKDKQ